MRALAPFLGCCMSTSRRWHGHHAFVVARRVCCTLYAQQTCAVRHDLVDDTPHWSQMRNITMHTFETAPNYILNII